MKKEHFMGKQWVNIQGEEQELSYWLMEERAEGTTLYGIKVVKKDREYASTGAISRDSEVVRQLIGRLMDCKITPCVLNEVVDDWYEVMAS